ncbi:serine/threonine protein kinase [Nonomuraea sp. MG754425]|nr:serine/threonine protein kinase [Nonomuraea sp. MG754425]
MGTVWRAADELLRQEVAIKEVRFPPGLDEAERTEMADRTLREARAAAALRDHPSIVTVHDVVLDEGRPWIVMELVRGRSLDRVVRDDGPLPPGRVAEIGLRMIAALSAAHASGILHRDVKPANVMLTDDGRVLLTDFGIATIAGDVALTQTGLLSGSPGYIAPERLRGENDGPSADLWSLGATLYTAVEGAPPFSRHNEAAVLAAVLMQEPAPFRLAGPLAPVLAAILDKDPGRRCPPDQASGLLAAIAQGEHRTGAQGGGPATAAEGGVQVVNTGWAAPGRRPEPTTRNSRPRRRRSKIILAAGLAVVLVVTAGVVVVPLLFPNVTRLLGYALTPRSTFTPSVPVGTPSGSPSGSPSAVPLVGEFEACDLLTAAQARSLVGQSAKRHWLVESSCSWRGDDFAVLTIMAYRAPSASTAAMMHEQAVKFMRDEPKRTPGTKLREGPDIGDGAYSQTGRTGIVWRGTPVYSTKVVFTLANVSVSITSQGRDRGYATADKVAKLVAAALDRCRRPATTD